MRAILLVHNLILISALLVSSQIASTRARILEQPSVAAAPKDLSSVAVSLQAANDATILFQAESQEEVSAPDSSARSIPHLVLKRNGVLTPGFERTLHLRLDNVAIPRSGLYVRVVLETEHAEPNIRRQTVQNIQVWNDTRYIPYSANQPISLDFNIVFDAYIRQRQWKIRTPTDYYSYHILFSDARGRVLQEIHQEFAFLLENQWRVPLPGVLEDTPGAAPQELLIYYYDMIPFQTDLRNHYTQIHRHKVDEYIQTDLVPALVRAFQTQSDLWGFPWYAEWSNFRPDEDPKTLSVALGEHGMWFHGAPASIGHAMISIRVDGTFAGYRQLTDGIVSVFQHELFHNQQRNISLHFGSQGSLFGKEAAWKMFSEGTAVLASLVGQPQVQFEPNAGFRSYLKRANSFLGAEESLIASLEKSYRDVPYHTAIYWRFLYENCGGLEEDQENPAEGMKVIRKVLEVLYGRQIVDINRSTAVAQFLPHIMDQAIGATPGCKFDTYRESLVQFARAIYLLRVEDGRCPAIQSFSQCGFYDPHHLYNVPRAEVHPVPADQPAIFVGSIPASYGIELIELDLDQVSQGQALKVIFKNLSGPEHEFNVEVWRLQGSGDDRPSRPHLASGGQPQSLQIQNGSALLEIEEINDMEFDRLGLVITRVDPHEDQAAAATYAIELVVE